MCPSPASVRFLRRTLLHHAMLVCGLLYFMFTVCNRGENGQLKRVKVVIPYRFQVVPLFYGNPLHA